MATLRPRIIRLLKNGWTVSRIAEHLECSHQLVGQVRDAAELPKASDEREERRAKVLELTAKGWPTTRIADHLTRHYGKPITRRVINRDLKAKGQSLTQEEIEARRAERIKAIPRMVKEGMMIWEIAEHFEVTAQAITNDIARYIPSLHKQPKLDARRDKVRELKAKGWSNQRIAEKLSTKARPVSIYNVESDVTWINQNGGY